MHWHGLKSNQKNNSHIEISVGLMTTSDISFGKRQTTGYVRISMSYRQRETASPSSLTLEGQT